MTPFNGFQADGHEAQNRKIIAVGAFAGAAIGLWAGRKLKTFSKQDRPDGMIDWTRSLNIAVTMNRGDTLTATERENLDRYYGELVDRCIPIVSEYTRSELPSNKHRTFAFDRVDWIHANMQGFQRMFEPIQELDSPVNGKGTAGRVMSNVNQSILSYEIGLLLGYLARRVLGQYDLALLGREPVETGGKLYYVEPNIRGVEAKLGLPKDDFRMWLALHETTHAFEFEAHPWVREHFNSLLERYMAFMKQDAEYLKQGLQGLKVFADRVRNRSESQGSWIEALMNDEQRALFNEMQAMMCVVEGYSNHVMNAVGKTLLPNYDLISRKFEERQRQRTQSEQLFARLTGLNVKMEQYRQGERFIDEIVALHGHDSARQVWDGPEFLPTMEEIRNPSLWSERVEAARMTVGSANRAG
jgi:coenzyme F420 biosynthesis associated uncharacterized protein